MRVVLLVNGSRNEARARELRCCCRSLSPTENAYCSRKSNSFHLIGSPLELGKYSIESMGVSRGVSGVSGVSGELRGELRPVLGKRER